MRRISIAGVHLGCITHARDLAQHAGSERENSDSEQHGPRALRWSTDKLLERLGGKGASDLRTPCWRKAASGRPWCARRHRCQEARGWCAGLPDRPCEAPEGSRQQYISIDLARQRSKRRGS